MLSMLEAPFAIVALCAPAIGQLAARAKKHHSFTSLLNIFSTRGSGSGKSGSSRSDYGVERTISYKVDYYNATSTTNKSSSEGWARNHNKPGFGSTTAFAAARRESAESQNHVDPAIPLGVMVPPGRDIEAQPQERSMVWGK
jgi:hypothetical protein